MTTSRWPNNDPERRCLKPAFWPTLDQAAWKRARIGGNILQPGGPASRWRPATVVNAEKNYGRFLTCLQRAGALDEASGPAHRVTPENVIGYVETLSTLNAPLTVAYRISGLFDVSVVLAPHVDFSWLDRIATHLMMSSAPARNKAVLVVASDELEKLGWDLMRRAEEERSRSNGAALRQLGLMIALLALVPLRRKNFHSIRIGIHLQKIGDRFWLIFPAGEMKNHRALEAPVPQRLTAPLERHLTVDRPVLAARDATVRAGRRPPGDALWLSKFGSALNSGGIYEQIRAATLKAFGHPINPHLFRDCAATTVAYADPAHVGSIRCILGHSSDRASAKHYNQAQGADAARQHQALIRSLRFGGGKPNPKVPARAKAEVTQIAPASYWRSRRRVEKGPGG